jgi:hypothetical protein
MSLLQAEKALRGAVVAALGSIATEHENFRTTPTANATLAHLFFIPTRRQPATLGTGGHDRQDGILQVDLDYPIGVGTSDAAQDYEQIADLFAAGMTYQNEDQVVTIRACERSGGRFIDQKYRVSLTISWQALIQR